MTMSQLLIVRPTQTLKMINQISHSLQLISRLLDWSDHQKYFKYPARHFRNSQASMSTFSLRPRISKRLPVRSTECPQNMRMVKKVLEKDGAVLPALQQKTGLRKLVNYIKATEQASGGTVVLVAHNGFNFDFPVLLNALERHRLINTLAEVKLLLLDSLKLIAEEVNSKQGMLSSCPSKSLGVVYEHLFNTKFNAHDAAEDTEALSRILMKTEVHINKATTHGLTLQDIQDRM